MPPDGDYQTRRTNRQAVDSDDVSVAINRGTEDDEIPTFVWKFYFSVVVVVCLFRTNSPYVYIKYNTIFVNTILKKTKAITGYE